MCPGVNLHKPETLLGLEGYKVKSAYNLFVRIFKPLTVLCNCTHRCVFNLDRNVEDRVSHNEAHINGVRKGSKVLVFYPYFFQSGCQR